MDKNKKASAYELLVNKMRKIDESATKDTVVKKLIICGVHSGKN